MPHLELAGSGLCPVNTNAEACWHRVVPPALCTCLKKTGTCGAGPQRRLDLVLVQAGGATLGAVRPP